MLNLAVTSYFLLRFWRTGILPHLVYDGFYDSLQNRASA